MKKFVYLSVLISLVLLVPATSAFAADFRVASGKSGNVYVEQGEVIKNLYTAGNLISIDANIQKGLRAAGNVVNINGYVGGTVYAGASTLMINGDVGGSVHGGGSSVIINSRISDDLLVGGGQVAVSKKASVGEDMFVAGGTVDIQGIVSGNAFISGGVVTINGDMRGNVKIKPADEIKIGKNARIAGNLEYSSQKEIEIEEGAVILGETTDISQAGSESATPSRGVVLAIIFTIISLSVLIKVGGLIVMGLILVYLFRNRTENVVRLSLTSFWKSLGVGVLFLIVIPIITIILLITLAGILLGIIVGLLYVLSILLAISFTSITFGSWLFKVLGKKSEYNVDWKVVVVGVIILSLLGWIPVIGCVIFAIFALISLGAIYRLSYRARK